MRFVALMSGCVIAMLAVAGTASASTVAVNRAGVLRLDARFGEVNGVTLREGSPLGTYVIDDSAGLTAGSGCAQVSTTRAQCLIVDASGAALIVAHGAGAGQQSPFMVDFARAMSARAGSLKPMWPLVPMPSSCRSMPPTDAISRS